MASSKGYGERVLRDARIAGMSKDAFDARDSAWTPSVQRKASVKQFLFR
jgi:hypothetical protein